MEVSYIQKCVREVLLLAAFTEEVANAQRSKLS